MSKTQVSMVVISSIAAKDEQNASESVARYCSTSTDTIQRNISTKCLLNTVFSENFDQKHCSNRHLIIRLALIAAHR